jgi:hypothetical protein
VCSRVRVVEKQRWMGMGRWQWRSRRGRAESIENPIRTAEEELVIGNPSLIGFTPVLFPSLLLKSQGITAVEASS